MLHAGNQPRGDRQSNRGLSRSVQRRKARRLRTENRLQVGTSKDNAKNIDKVMKELDRLGEEYEKRVAEKLPENLKKMPITPSDGPVTVTMIFEDNNLTFGIDINEDYYRIDREILEYLKDSLKPTSKILGYTVEPKN